jgi:hypothetical protein
MGLCLNAGQALSLRRSIATVGYLLRVHSRCRSITQDWIRIVQGRQGVIRLVSKNSCVSCNPGRLAFQTAVCLRIMSKGLRSLSNIRSRSSVIREEVCRTGWFINWVAPYFFTATRSISTLQPGTSRPVTPTVVRGGGEGKYSFQTWSK